MGMIGTKGHTELTPINPEEIITQGRPTFYSALPWQTTKHDLVHVVRQYKVTNQYGLLNGWQIYSPGSQLPSHLKYIPGIIFPGGGGQSTRGFRTNRQYVIPKPGGAGGRVILGGPASAALLQTTKYPTPPTLAAYLMGRVRPQP